MKIYVVRHGQTNYNVLGLNNVDPTVDVHLTEAGVAEAKAVAEKLKDVTFDVFFVSELPRTQQTAELINESRNVPILVDGRLNDIDTGFEGKSVNEYHIQRNAAEDAFKFKVPGAESPEEVYRRTESFLKDLKQKNYQNVLVVTSKHNFRHFQSIIDGLDPRKSLRCFVKNAEILEREI